MRIGVTLIAALAIAVPLDGSIAAAADLMDGNLPVYPKLIDSYRKLTDLGKGAFPSGIYWHVVTNDSEGKVERWYRARLPGCGRRQPQSDTVIVQCANGSKVQITFGDRPGFTSIELYPT